VSQRPRHGYAAGFPRGLPRPLLNTVVEVLAAPFGRRDAPRPAQIRQVRAGVSLRDVKRRFLAYSSPPRSPDPPHLAVLDTSRLCQGRSRPPRHHPDQAALSFNPTAATAGWCSRGRTGARYWPCDQPVSPARPPHRTCDSHRIRRSTDSLWGARLRPSRISSTVLGCCSPASDTG
jgi:hypothetical protein